MNERAFREIGRPANVTLLYDATTQRIGVKFPVSIDRHFFPARRYGRGRRMRIVRAARMLKQFGIEVERTLVFQGVRVEKFRKEPMLVLELESARVIGGETGKSSNPDGEASNSLTQNRAFSNVKLFQNFEMRGI